MDRDTPAAASLSTYPLLDQDFDISEKTGFVPDPAPLKTLPPVFDSWEDVVQQLTQLLQEKRMRAEIDNIPEFDVAKLKDAREYRRAYLVLTTLAQGYLWMDGEAGLPTKLPAILAIPLSKVAKHLELPPIITYASSVLYNWGLVDSSKSMKSEGNLYALVNYTGTSDESWFFVSHVLIELEVVPALKAIMECLAARNKADNLTIRRNLDIIENALISMMKTLNTVFKNCNPKVFYVNIRPYVAGMPVGIVYEGVDEIPRKYRGASGAQTTSIACIDAFLGGRTPPISHRDENMKILEEFCDHMPPKHRKFVKYISSQPSMRTYIMENGDQELKKQYNSTLRALFDFRSAHIQLVKTFIIDQIPVVHTGNVSLEKAGSGDTDLKDFLKQIREDADTLKIPT